MRTQDNVHMIIRGMGYGLLALLLIVPACQTGWRSADAHLTEALDAVKKTVAPDKRVAYFNVELSQRGKDVVIAGELTSEATKAMVFAALKKADNGITFVDSLQVLPDDALGDEIYGIVRVSVAPMRGRAAHSSEMVNQTLLGTVLPIFKARGSHFFIQNWDNYLGWIPKSSVVTVNADDAQIWKDAPKVICISNYGLVHKQRDEDSPVVVDLIHNAVLKKIRYRGNWIEVETPDGSKGWVRKKNVMDGVEFLKVRPSSKRIETTAEAFLGVPYLWGGTSAKGLDCSGFVQTVFRLNNVALPRDASQIVHEGESVPLDESFSQLKKGDMLFFGSNPERITHCGIYLGDRKYIHSSGWVKYNSFDPDDPLYSKYLKDILRAAKRVPLEN